MNIEELKERRKGYTSAFGYLSCREDDFDWLVERAELLEKLIPASHSLVNSSPLWPQCGKNNVIELLAKAKEMNNE